jgi:hypothetical protein
LRRIRCPNRATNAKHNSDNAMRVRPTQVPRLICACTSASARNCPRSASACRRSASGSIAVNSSRSAKRPKARTSLPASALRRVCTAWSARSRSCSACTSNARSSPAKSLARNATHSVSMVAWARSTVASASSQPTSALRALKVVSTTSRL